jgi:hypothetical protein
VEIIKKAQAKHGQLEKRIWPVAAIQTFFLNDILPSLNKLVVRSCQKISLRGPRTGEILMF